VLETTNRCLRSTAWCGGMRINPSSPFCLGSKLDLVRVRKCTRLPEYQNLLDYIPSSFGTIMISVYFTKLFA
jgi:hypothetical protein